MIVTVHYEMEIAVNVDYTPARPAPACGNPSSPRYSDPGDDEVIEINDISAVLGEAHAIPIHGELKNYIADMVADQVADKCREQIGGEL